MTRLLIKWFVPDCDRPQQEGVRRAYGRLGGVVGVAVNVLLFALKLLAGLLTGSVAILADAFNNLSDAGTSVVTLAGFHLAGQEADEEHPFGHGRMEYLAGLVVAMAIVLVGFELGKASVEKILRPQSVELSVLTAAILAAAVAAKLWLFAFNRTLARRTGSATLKAIAVDCLSDAAATTLVLAGALAGQHFGIHIDGWMGLLVALFILRAGWMAARETMDPLLGRAMDPELAADIDRLVLDHPYILGIHDVVYHDYGPGRAMMSFHAEVPADADLLEVHDVIDHIERELKQRNGIETVIHMDPVVRDERTMALRMQVEGLAQGLGAGITIHDFRITAGPIHTNVLFDVVVPFGFCMTDSQVRQRLAEEIRTLGEQYYPVIEVERSYVERKE